MTATASAIVR